MKLALYLPITLTLILPFFGAEKPQGLKDVEPRAGYFYVHKKDAGHPVISVQKDLALSPDGLHQEVIRIKTKNLLATKKASVVATKKIKKVSAKPISTGNNRGRSYVVTAYTAGKESTGKSKGHPDFGKTASGTIVKEGRTASCPPSLKFGTRITIPELNETYVCEDRGAAIKEGRIDIYIENLRKARAFGKKTLKVIVSKLES